MHVRAHEPAQPLEAHRRQADLADVPTACTGQRAVERVHPCMVGARNDARHGERLAAGLRMPEQLVASVLADVVERAETAAVVDHKHRLVADRGGEHLAVGSHLGLVADHHPRSGEHRVHLGIEDRLVVVVARRQRASRSGIGRTWHQCLVGRHWTVLCRVRMTACEHGTNE